MSQPPPLPYEVVLNDPAPFPHVPQPGQVAIYPAGQEWSDWFPFPRSSNISAARFKLDRSGTWEVMFGGKPKKPTKKNPYATGTTALSCYTYTDPRLTEETFWRWVDQYTGGGSAGIWFDLNVKRAGITGSQMWTQGA